MLRRFITPQAITTERRDLQLLRRCVRSSASQSRHVQLKALERRIVDETKVSKQHLTPEIALHLITSECRLFHAPVLQDSDKVFELDPFWGFYWPGGQAVSRYILDNPEVVKGKSVLDVGAGCGATSLAALMSNAKYAVANDIDEAALCATLLNAKLNNIENENGAKLKISSQNLIGSPHIPEDVIFLGDVFYDEEFAKALLPWLHQMNENGKEIYVGDPGRHGLTAGRLSFMKKLATYELTENCCIENAGFKFVNIWRFSNDKQ